MQRFFNLSYKDIEMMVRIAAWGKVNMAEVATSVTMGNILKDESRTDDPAVLIGPEAIYRCLNPICVFTAFVDAAKENLVGRGVDIPFSSEELRWLEAIAGHVGMSFESAT